ncbi:hypothetical protein G7047_00570 [Diaphorobacter sp. HDW4A]|uniref:hypothetical protein n=1 Tax=Diaphorobacter sp. HDW4A TaxID=2714924 RepID=UPI001407E304|nr:hypothetical protein [Diaphorobacter sp. HDW4A]QIL78578.1 hypothetical protein G7047_00570 [Diaphorobacter sp. HDW4A]
MNKLGLLFVALSLVGCAGSPTLEIHNPEIFATQQPLVDDDGIPLALPVKHWAEGNSRMVD